VDNLRRGRPLCFKGQSEVSGDPVRYLLLFDERDASHPATACRIRQRIQFGYLVDHFSLAFRRHKHRLFFNDRREERVQIQILCIFSLWALE